MRSLIIAAVCAAFTATAAAAVVPPDELAKRTTAQLQKEISTRQAEFRKDSGKLYEAVDRIVTPHFDLRYITQLILARHWKSATDEQRARFETAFKNMLIRSYANALLEFSNSVKTEWQPVEVGQDTQEVTVQSKLIRENGPPLPIGFAMRLRDGEWKVYDITVENLSLVMNFRSQAASEIRRDGIDSLIQKLESGQGLVATKGTGG